MDTAREIPSGREDEPVKGERGQAAGASPPVRANALDALLAGLQAGMAGTLAMLAWFGLSTAWQGRGFWRAENLMASVFYGASAVRAGFSWRTVSGLALYLVLYSLLGAAVALLLRRRLARVRTMLLSIAIAVLWYYITFHWLWRSLAPPLAFLHAEQPTLLGHVIYGLWLGRFPEYLIGDQGARIGDQEAQLPALEGAPGAADTPPANSDNHLREP
jgi:hypothetical protein